MTFKKIALILSIKYPTPDPPKLMKKMNGEVDLNSFVSGQFSSLIDLHSKAKTSDGSKTARNVRKVLPTLVSWAKTARTNGTYDYFSEE